MATLEIIIAITAFLLYLTFRAINKYFAYAYLFVIFIFAFVVSNKEFSTFYLILFLIAIVLDVGVGQISEGNYPSSFKAGSLKLNGVGLTLFYLGAGGLIYLIIQMLSKGAGGTIVGVPNLAVTTSSIGATFKPTFESMLGIIENTITFVIFDLLMVFGMLIPLLSVFFMLIPYVLPIMITSLVLAAFHVSAYSVSISLMLYAMSAFAIFITSKVLLRDSLPADTAHFLNNLTVSVSRGLAIAHA